MRFDWEFNWTKLSFIFFCYILLAGNLRRNMNKTTIYTKTFQWRIRQYLIKTSTVFQFYYYNCIPFTIRLWNTLPLHRTESPSFYIFRNRTTYFYKTWDIYEFHNLGIRLCFLSFALRIVVAHLASSNSSHCQLRNEISNMKVYLFNEFFYLIINKGNNKITELRTILQRESQNS